jgi:hypothetical protein
MTKRRVKRPERYDDQEHSEAKRHAPADDDIEESVSRLAEAYAAHGPWKTVVRDGKVFYKAVKLSAFDTRVTDASKARFRKRVQDAFDALGYVHKGMIVTIRGGKMSARWNAYEKLDDEPDDEPDPEPEPEPEQPEEPDVAEEPDAAAEPEPEPETESEDERDARPRLQRFRHDRFSRTHGCYVATDCNKIVKCQVPGCNTRAPKPGVPASRFLVEFARRGRRGTPSLLAIRNAVMTFDGDTITYVGILGLFCRCQRHSNNETVVPIQRLKKAPTGSSEMCDCCGEQIGKRCDIRRVGFMVVCPNCNNEGGNAANEGAGTTTLARAMSHLCKIFSFEARDATVRVSYVAAGQEYLMRADRTNQPTYNNDGVLTIAITSPTHDYEVHGPAEIDGGDHLTTLARAKDAVATLVGMDAVEQLNRRPTGTQTRRTRKYIGFRFDVSDANVQYVTMAYAAKSWIANLVWKAIDDFYDPEVSVLPQSFVYCWRVQPHQALLTANVAARITRLPSPPEGHAQSWCNHPGGLLAMHRVTQDPDRPAGANGNRGNRIVLREVVDNRPNPNDTEIDPLEEPRHTQFIPNNEWQRLFDEHPPSAPWKRLWDASRRPPAFRR